MDRWMAVGGCVGDDDKSAPAAKWPLGQHVPASCAPKHQQGLLRTVGFSVEGLLLL